MVRIREAVNRDHALARCVVAAISWPEPDTPSRGSRFGDHVWLFIVGHAGVCADGIFARKHFDKSVSFVAIDDAGLHAAEAAKYLPEVGFCTVGTANEEGPAEHFDMVLWNTSIQIGPLKLLRPARNVDTSVTAAQRRSLTIFSRRRRCAVVGLRSILTWCAIGAVYRAGPTIDILPSVAVVWRTASTAAV